ncbi:MAG: ImmA/IrrE family metallo-endopeptidase [Ruminococcus sp.]|nr:ImmA/IrrE family metallo-endopeptidase [Ruminococcus sp.]
MNYGIYKNARNASWQCLIDCNVISLPINPIAIADKYDLKCKLVDPKTIKGTSGEIRKKVDGSVVILFNANHPKVIQAFTIMHEIGHYVLGYLGNEPLSRNYNSIRPEEEQAADRFAADILMPACVLWGLNIHTPEEIAKLCNVSMQAATIRAERMEILYQRNKFLLHPLERQAYAQFGRFIQNYKR